jgi:hypothetical protein
MRNKLKLWSLSSATESKVLGEDSDQGETTHN